MARTVRSASLETRAARLRLEVRAKPYWAPSGKAELHLGYRRLRNKNGAWVARRYVGVQKYVTSKFAEADDYSDADSVGVIGYFDAMKRLSGDAPPARHGSVYRVADAISDYIATLQLNGTTAPEAQGVLNHYLAGFLTRDGREGGERVLADLTHNDFKKWPAWALANRPLGRRKKKTEPIGLSEDEAEEVLRRRKERVNRVLNNVLACLNYAFDNEKVTTNAAWSKLKRFKGTEQPRVRWLDMDETRRLINACAPDFRKIVQGALLTGARWSELRRIRVQDYDSEGGTVLIARTKRKKARHVYLTDEGRRAFDEWTTGSERAAAVFVWAEGSNWGSHDQHRPIAAAREAAKLSDDVTFHVLRHTYASLLVKAGVHLMIVAQSLGHSDTRMVEKHYGHLAPSHAAETIRANLPTFGVATDSNVRTLRP